MFYNNDALLLIIVNFVNSLWVMLVFIFHGYFLKKLDHGSLEIIAEEEN